MPSKVRIPVQVYMKQVYKDLENDHLYRVVLTGHGQSLTYLARMDGNRLDVRCLDTEEFRKIAGANETATRGYVLIKEDPFKKTRSSQRATPRHKGKSEENFELIEELVDLRSAEGLRQFIELLKPGSKRKEILERRARDAEVDRRVIYRYFRQYLQRGMVPLAVCSGYPNSGRQSKEQGKRRTYRSAPGRKSRYPKPDIMLPSELRDRIMHLMADCLYTKKQAVWDVDLPETIEAELARNRGQDQKASRSSGRANGRRSARGTRNTPRRGRRSRATIRNVVLRFNYLIRCKRVVRNAQGSVIEVQLRDFDAITEDQLRYFLRTWDAKEKLRRSMGEGKFASQGRARRGHALQHCRGPGHVFMVDATVADIFLVSCLDLTVVVGRPTVYFVVDVWSRMIVGLHVSFRRPSFEGAALAMISAVTPKQLFCAEYGFSISDADWPCRYIGAKIHSDRGCEYLQALPWQIMSERFGVEIDNSAAYEPYWRGVAERRFGIIPVIAQRNGYAVVEKAGDALRGSNPAIDALWTRAQFVRELLRAIHRYHREPISGTIDAPPEMVSLGWANSPLNRWNWGVEKSLAMLQACDVEEITHAVLVPDHATITRSGLTLDGIDYTSRRIMNEYSARAGKARKENVDVRYNPDRLGQFSLSGADECPEFATLSRTNSLDLSNVTRDEWQLYRKIGSANASTARLANEAHEMVLELNSAEDRHEATERQKAALKAAGKTRLDTKNVKEAKAHEAEVERALRNRSSQKASGPGREPDEDASGTSQYPDANLFKTLINAGAAGLLGTLAGKSKSGQGR